jgi:hypothetical protein
LKGKGIAERAERILILSILAFIPFRDNISVALWIISILAIITILERLKIVSAIFGVPLFSIQTFKQIFQREDMTNRDYTLGSNPSDSSSNTNSKLSPAKSSINTKEVESRPEIKKDTKIEESKSKTLPKANFLDKTDPNETGRNVAQLIFEQEEEDKKAPTKPATTTSTNSKNENNNSSNTSQSSTTSTSTNSKKDVNKTTNDNQVQEKK